MIDPALQVWCYHRLVCECECVDVCVCVCVCVEVCVGLCGL